MLRTKPKVELDHIGIKANDVGKYVKLFKRLGGVVTYRGVAEKYDADCTFIRFKNIDIEIIKGIKGDRYNINKQKDGLHHIAFKGKGRFRGAKPNMLVDFNKPNKKNSILIEKVCYDKRK